MKQKSFISTKRSFSLLIKTVAYVLSFLLILYAVPATVYAEIIDTFGEASENATSNAEPTQTDNTDASYERAVFEVVDRREETVKQFRAEDGSYVAAQYNYPVHELDANGEWQDIDNTLAESGSEYATPNARVKFAKKITGSETLFTLHDGNRKITMNMSGANKKVAGQVTNTHTEFGEEATELQKLMALDKLSSRILYPEILEDVNLEYVVQPDSIKENIIVKEKSDVYRYSFDIRLNNLAATLQEDGSVCIADPDTNEVVYVIPAGYMFDGAGEYSDAVQYELADNGSGKYTLTVTADAEWINADERVFPVTIDPTINYNNYDYSSVVQAGYVSSSSPTGSFVGSTTLYAGYTSSLGYFYSYIQMTTLPDIPDNASITNATLQMKFSDWTNKVIPVGVHYVVTEWDRSTLTYLNRPTTHSNPIDYEGLKDVGVYNWDITTLMRNWYDGTYENHGVMIATVNSTDTRVSFNNASSPTSTTSAPSFIITYKDTKGIESYYSYYSSSADLAGEGRINAMTGNLAFVHSSIPTTDEILPYTVSLVYNSGLSNQFYTNTSDAIIPIANKTIGKGFKMSYDETIKTLTTVKSQKMYVWADSDGTEHYFTPENYSSGEKRYCDEDGIGVYLYLESEHGLGSGYQIRDDIGNIKHFSSGGYLDYILDISGNKRTFNRNSSNQVTSITLTPKGSSTITQIQMAFSSGMLTTITNQQTGLSARMYYSSTYNGAVSQTPSNFLRKIVYTYAAGTTYTVSYEYDSSGRLIMAKDLKSKMAIFYEYSSKGEVIQVAQYANATETSTISAMTLGKKAIISYGALHSYYISARETNSTSDDVTTYYRFDPSGRVTSAYTQDANNLYGASNRTYDDSSVKKQNAVSSVLQIGTDTVNYLLNPGFELYDDELFPTHWTVNNDSSCEPKNDSERTSSTYLRLTATNSTRTARAAQTFRLPAGTYTASATFDRSDLGQNGKARLVILDNAGNEIASSDYLRPFEANRATADVQETKSVTFTVTGTTCATSGWTLAAEVSFINTPQSGEEECILVDNVMLEKSAGASRYSLLGNGGFENNSSSSIPEWTLSNAQRTETRRDGQYGISVSGAPASQAYAYNKVICNQSSYTMFTDIPESYIISGWAKAESAYSDPSRWGSVGEPIFALKAVVHYMGTTDTTIVYIPFNDHCTQWQFATGVVSSTPLSDGSYRRISSIDVYCCYDYNINTAYFDNISVAKDSNCVTTYSYNANGYVENAGSSDGNGVSYNYAPNGIDVSNATSTDGTGAKFTYDANHRILTETVTAKVNGVVKDQNKTTYSYDSFGNITSTTVQDMTSTGTSLYSSSTFSTSSTNFGAVLTTTDANYRTNRMFYDSKARLIGMCDNAGHGLVYTYDNYGRVTEIAEATYNSTSNTMVKTSGGTTVSNVYDSSDTRGLLEKITTSTATYVFEYDTFGNVAKISVNGYTLISNTYEEKNGNLTQSIYGNQDCVKYAYDNVDRITDIWYNDYKNGNEPAYSYTYNANGDLSSHTDYTADLIYVYMYDHRGNISQRTTKDTSDNTKCIEVYKYDDQGRLVEIWYNYFNAGNAPTLSFCRYTYDELGNVKSIKHGGSGGNLQYTYDGLGRIDTEHVSHTDGTSSDIFTKDYDYSGNEVEWVWGYDKYDNRYDTEYEYDAAGNITKIEITGDTIDDVIQRYTYQYDSKNQLTRENLFFGSGNSANRTMVYTYDSAGNILSKKRYAYTEATSVSGTPTTNSYGYASTWKDRLTSFDGKSISYDAIGNPTSYGSYTYDWKYGRQLASISNSSTELSVSYQYNDEGIRTVKIVSGVRHEYDVVGGQINREVIYSSNNSYIAKDIRYFYDANGNPSSIRVFARTSATATPTKTTYYLLTNIQGDVVGIYNDSGTKIYEYAYDAWGNIIKSSQVATGGNAAHAVNPFRYRGYYYDAETGLYYLQSRYYNPEWGRFLNADCTETFAFEQNQLMQYNIFAYCYNNPVNMADSNGYLPFFIVTGIAGAVIGGIAGYAKTGSWKGVATGALIGGAVGLTGGAAAAQLLAGQAVASTGAVIAGGKAVLGIVSTAVYPTWQAAEQALRKAMNSVQDVVSRTFATPFGNRIADAFNIGKKVIGEAKYGYQSLSQHISLQIQKDAWLLQNNPQIKAVEWHFYHSAASDSHGLSAPLREALIKAGIKIIEHYK